MTIAPSKLMGQDCRRRQNNAFLARSVPLRLRPRLRMELAAGSTFSAAEL
jgi:hypothetical protein